MDDEIVERLAYEMWHNPPEGDTADAHWLAADALYEIKRLWVELAAERVLADQLADALRTVLHDRPSAHTDNVWAVINHALITYEEVRRER